MKAYAAEAAMCPEVRKVLADPRKAADLLRRILEEKASGDPQPVRVHGLSLRTAPPFHLPVE